MTDFAQRMNAITIEQLRATGATKWSATDDSIGAFVAEMDFGVDPAITAALHAAVDDGAFGYMPQRIAADLSDATAGFLERRYGWSVPASDVWGIPDVIMGLELAMEHCSARSTKLIWLRAAGVTGRRPSAGSTTQRPPPQARQVPRRSVKAGPPVGPVSPRRSRRTTIRCPTTCGPSRCSPTPRGSCASTTRGY